LRSAGPRRHGADHAGALDLSRADPRPPREKRRDATGRRIQPDDPEVRSRARRNRDGRRQARPDRDDRTAAPRWRAARERSASGSPLGLCRLSVAPPVAALRPQSRAAPGSLSLPGAAPADLAQEPRTAKPNPIAAVSPVDRLQE